MKHYLLFFALLTLCLVSCEEPQVMFGEPQPSGQANLKTLPTALRGDYLSTKGTDSIVLHITRDMVYRDGAFRDTARVKQLRRSGCELRGDTLICDDGQPKRIQRLRDSLVVIDLTFSDTLFAFYRDDILRRDERVYFMNLDKGDKGWRVIKLDKNDAYLVISEIESREELRNLKKTMQVDTIRGDKNDPKKVTDYKVNPTIDEFRRFVAEQGFRKTESYRRIKN